MGVFDGSLYLVVGAGGVRFFVGAIVLRYEQLRDGDNDLLLPCHVLLLLWLGPGYRGFEEFVLVCVYRCALVCVGRLFVDHHYDVVFVCPPLWGFVGYCIRVVCEALFRLFHGFVNGGRLLGDCPAYVIGGIYLEGCWVYLSGARFRGVGQGNVVLR